MTKTPPAKPDKAANLPAGATSTSTAIGFLIVQEVARVVRWLIIAGLIAYCVKVIMDGVVSIMQSEQPTTWQQVAIITVTTIGGVLVGQIPIFRTLWKFRGFIRTVGNRGVELEAMMDADRTSSGLNKDGTNDLDS